MDEDMAERRGEREYTAVEPRIWYAIAGGSLSSHLPSVGSTVFYFPQGHLEHSAACEDPDLDRLPRDLPSSILCKVLRIDFLADSETDQVFARLLCRPLDLPSPARLHAISHLSSSADHDAARQDSPSPSTIIIPEPPHAQQQPPSFAKTLTQSDANNGGGFSIPRFCAETIFPRLDYSKDPPVQTVSAKDVHGVVWKFRHIYRGTPRRHLLSTGWSGFVNSKKLVAGDVVVFLQSNDAMAEICVGIRRCSSKASARPWPRCRQSGDLRMDRSSGSGELATVAGHGHSSSGGDGCVRKAVEAAASGKPFEMVYYPSFGFANAGFCVDARTVKAAMENAWMPGMRVKMAVETEDSSRTSWYLGTVLKVQDVDPVRWPDSPWKKLQVSWDETTLRNAGRVSPWQVEPVSASTQMNLPLLLSLGSRKKTRHSAQDPLQMVEALDDCGAGMKAVIEVNDDAPIRKKLQLWQGDDDPGGGINAAALASGSDGVWPWVAKAQAVAWREPGRRTLTMGGAVHDEEASFLQVNVARLGYDDNGSNIQTRSQSCSGSKYEEGKGKQEWRSSAAGAEGGEAVNVPRRTELEETVSRRDGDGEEQMLSSGKEDGNKKRTQFRLFGRLMETGTPRAASDGDR